MNKTIKNLHIIDILLMTFGFCLTAAHAQSGVGVSPPRVELTAQPGDQITQVVNVDNPGGSALSVNVVLSDVLLAPDGSVLWIEPGSHPNSLAPWLTINPLQFELAPREGESVTYTATIPAGTPDGTYWGVMFFQSEAPEAEEVRQEGGVGISSRVRVGHIIYITVGQPTLSGRIVGVRHQPNELRVTFQNTGEGLLRLDGRAEVRSTTGELLQTLTLEGVASFPGATHDLVFPLSEPLDSGEYVVLVVLDYGEAEVIAGEARVEVP